MFLFAQNFIAIDFWCQLHAQPETDMTRPTSDPPQILWLRLKFVGKLKTLLVNLSVEMATEAHVEGATQPESGELEK